MLSRLLALVAIAVSGALSTGPEPGTIKNLVTFGDSYTTVVSTGDGRTAWPIYASRYGPFNLSPFALGGAQCTNNLTTHRTNTVFEVQLPLYDAEVKNGTLKLDPATTMYTLWIGTNDVSYDNLLGGKQKPGVTIVDTVACAVNWIKTLYDSGARNFLFQNMVPLEKTVVYSANSYPNPYFRGPRNTTEWSLFMSELVSSGNEIAMFEVQKLAESLQGAHIGLFDSHSLFNDIVEHPTNYLNGTAPLNVTGCVHSCVYAINGSKGNCTTVQGSARDSFMWYDELHPSEQTYRVVAREVTDVILRKSNNWTTWLS